MRRMQRPPLPLAAQNYLDQRQQAADQQQADGTLDIERRWADARQTQAIAGTADSVLATLRQMAGQGARCMYCSDSRGTDIEHFRPKAAYPTQAFRWPNLLLCCSACGRLKGARFPLDPAGEPLFIDPSHDDPWAHLNFVPETGALMPREWRDADLTLQCSEKGRWTAQILLGDERIQDGWRRTWRRSTSRDRRPARSTHRPSAMASSRGSDPIRCAVMPRPTWRSSGWPAVVSHSVRCSSIRP